MHPLSIMIKPASSNCNMRCKYCFYFDEADNREIPSYGFISGQTTENLIKKALEFAVNTCGFAFQGGEPTVIGVEYFKKFVALVEKYNTRNIDVSFSLQTNGYLIDDEFAEFFAKNKFLIGISLDGVKDTNDLNRVDISGKSTYNKVLHAIDLFKKHKVDFNVLSVVTKQSSKSIQKNYNFFKKNGILWHQYIACLDPIADERGIHNHSLNTVDYANFLKKLFDLWYADVINRQFVSIRYFDDILGIFVNGQGNSCTVMGQCSFHYVVEADGEIYPCDFYMLDDYKIGNINDVGFEQMDENRNKLQFIQKSAVHPEECKSCKWYGLCRNGCRRDREDFATGEIGKTYLCEAYKEFFEYSYERFAEIARMLRTGQL